MNTAHHIVIVGGGAGGLGLATQLGHKLGKAKKAKITLVDAHEIVSSFPSAVVTRTPAWRRRSSV